jgi:hypothetical protein
LKKTLNQKPFFVEMAIIITLIFAVPAGRDHRHGLFFRNLLQELFRIVRTIRNDALKFIVFNTFANYWLETGCKTG